MLAENRERSRFQEVCNTMYEHLVAGESFSQAMAKSEGFPGYAVEMAATGEQSGHLEQVMRNLEVYYDEEDRMFNKLRSSVGYPAALLVITGVCGVLATIWKGLEAFRQLTGAEKKENAREGMFRWYLTRILINECRNIQRRRMREFPAETPPAAAWDAPADYRELYAAIDALPEALRLPRIVKYIQGASEREGAMALGIPVTTFKSRLHRARRTLRKKLDREVMFE